MTRTQLVGWSLTPRKITLDVESYGADGLRVPGAIELAAKVGRNVVCWRDERETLVLVVDIDPDFSRSTLHVDGCINNQEENHALRHHRA